MIESFGCWLCSRIGLKYVQIFSKFLESCIKCCHFWLWGERVTEYLRPVSVMILNDLNWEFWSNSSKLNSKVWDLVVHYCLTQSCVCLFINGSGLLFALMWSTKKSGPTRQNVTPGTAVPIFIREQNNSIIQMWVALRLINNEDFSWSCACGLLVFNF